MRTVFLSGAADARLKRYLENAGYDIRQVSTSGLVSPPVSDHPDMFMCRLGISGDSPIITCLDLSQSETQKLYTGCRISTVLCSLSSGYPAEAAFNAACTGRYFIHNLKHTDACLLSAAEDSGMILVDVHQGYAKCSTVIVDQDSIITYDRGIAAKCTKAGMNVLIVDPGHIRLDGYAYGFIGGTSGRIGTTVYFNGDLSAHPDFRSITSFIEERGLCVKWFPEWKLTDIGSII